MARIRILQIESIYPQFSEAIYRDWVGLDRLSFSTQIKTILSSGWSGGQNVVPHLNPSKWDRFYIIPRLVPAQAAWGRERNLRPSEMNLREILRQQLHVIKPQVIYLSDITSFDFSILNELIPRPLIVGWLASRFPTGIPWTEIDLLLSGISAIRNEALQLGVKQTADFNSAAPAFFGVNSQATQSNFQHPSVGFAGSFFGGYHDDRAKMFASLASTHSNLPFHIYTGQRFTVSDSCQINFHKPVFASEVLETYSMHAFVIDARADFGLGEPRFNRDTSNMRIFEATRAGTLLLTEYAPNLERLFDLGKDIICYHSEEELNDLLEFFAKPSSSNTCETIADSGFNRTLSSHMIEHRAAEFGKIIGKLLA